MRGGGGGWSGGREDRGGPSGQRHRCVIGAVRWDLFLIGGQDTMVAAAGPLNRFGGGRHLWLATVPVAESPLNGGLSVANEAQPILFF